MAKMGSLNFKFNNSYFDMNELIFFLLENILKRDITLKVKYNIINTFSKFDIRINQGKRHTLHLEALILEIFNVLS
jgi:replication initiation and membrane attachment protein DnaB